MIPNPFTALIGAASDSQEATEYVVDEAGNRHLEDVFLFTLNKEARDDGQQLVFMEDMASGLPTQMFNFELLGHAVFERLLMTHPKNFLIPNHSSDARTAAVAESKALIYLFRCYGRNETYRNKMPVELYQRIQEIIIQNVITALKQPDLYDGQDLSAQLLEILQSDETNWDYQGRFLSASVKEADDLPCLEPVFRPLFSVICNRIEGATLGTLEKWILPVLMLFVADKTNANLAKLLLNSITPKTTTGTGFSNTILGQLLSLSILPRTDQMPLQYFESPGDTKSNMRTTLWDLTSHHLDNLHGLIKGFLLMGGDIRTGILTWLAQCVNANTKRGQIWTADLGGVDVCSDAFMINLIGVLLRLSQPLVRPQLKVLLVDPTYVNVATAEARAEKQVHMLDLDKETCLLPTEEDEDRLTAPKYNFITEIFFLTHKALDLGMRVVVEKLIQINRSLVEQQRMYQEILDSTRFEGFPQEIRKNYQKFACYLYAILSIVNDGAMVNFYEATAVWLCQCVAGPEKGFAPTSLKEFQLPVTETNAQLLKAVPEFIFENIVGFLSFAKHFNMEPVEIKEQAQSAIFTMILMFMGSAERVRNPHLRARLAEALECLLPTTDNAQATYRQFTDSLFRFHPDRTEIVPNLLRVFVGIEMTGQSVQFEQKFNYRRPMYAIMEYLWQIEEQRQCFREMAQEAERSVEAVEPPVFLRFTNLLINDAIFLLDESLSNLQQIRTLQEAEDSGAWNDISASERQQNRANLRHLGMMARFDNILGRDTINMLVLLTSEISGIFTHSSMVDRVAAMLNYFLLNLVGPKKDSLKVIIQLDVDCVCRCYNSCLSDYYYRCETKRSLTLIRLRRSSKSARSMSI